MAKKSKKRKTAADTLSLPVWKTVYTFTVYGNRQISPNAELPDVIADATDGDLIGECALIEQKTIDPKQVRRALKSIGNDGTFFDRNDD